VVTFVTLSVTLQFSILDCNLICWVGTWVVDHRPEREL